jgi:hypothetical protein
MKKMQGMDKHYGRKRGERGRKHARSISATKRITSRNERRERKRREKKAPDEQGRIEKRGHWGFET